MENLLGGILNRERSRHATACCWWVTTGCVEAVHALEVAGSAINSSELEPGDGTVSLVALSLNRAHGCGRIAGFGTRQRSDLLLGSVEVKEGHAEVGEVVQARDLEVGWVWCCGVGA